MRRRNTGDSMGKVDSDGIATWYPNCKVRFDGSHYIATPHTTNPAKRTVHTEEKISVFVKNGKYAIENKLNETLNKPVETKNRSPFEITDGTRLMTRKEIFDELYDKYLYMKSKERKKAIYTDMLPFFNEEADLQNFIQDNCYRRWRNTVVRRQRFARKAYNQRFQWFATFTYADNKHDENSFKQRLSETLRRLATRHKWLYMGVWERGKDTDRLHFHALVYIPDGETIGELEEITDYNKKTGRQKTFMQNTFFAEKFGRNEFDDISFSDRVYGKAIGYVMKYMAKQNAKAVYSRGLYEYFYSDIQGKDVTAKMETTDETDNRLILAPDFTCWDEGAMIGKISRDTIAKMPKAK